MLSDIMKHVMERLVIDLKSQHGYRVEFAATESKKSAADLRRPLTSAHSTARGDPAPFVFRQETGMQKRGREHGKERKMMGGGTLNACVHVCV